MRGTHEGDVGTHEGDVVENVHFGLMRGTTHEGDVVENVHFFDLDAIL